jgi:hypothetical protein
MALEFLAAVYEGVKQLESWAHPSSEEGSWALSSNSFTPSMTAGFIPQASKPDY